MAKENKKPEAAGGGDVVAIGSGQCLSEECKKKASRAGFCEEHYVWFKEGLLNKKGQRPSDFDKKHQAFLARKKAA